MKRRDFLKSVTAGLVAATGAYGLDTHKPLPSNDSAIWYLTKAYNAECKGKLRKTPKTIIVSEELYNAYSSELLPLQRFMPTEVADNSYKTLMFKSLTMIKSPHLQDWNYIFVYNA